jgi:glycosyltransferase involved in cell wall biosynthesis
MERISPQMIPDVSVVMSVYNAGSRLRETLDSVLSQQHLSFEFIIVDDGSTDQTPEILESYRARDRRVKLLHQENQGLTKGLIRGCAAAVGKYIARQDAGDVSLPDRLVRQFNFIKQHPDASFASCGTQYVAPNGEYLYEVKRDQDNATELLRNLRLDPVQGPSSHPSTIFPRAMYQQVGGYRSVFYFAQDLDLWIRLAEQGPHMVMTDVLYKAAFTLGSISGKYRTEQMETARLILESARRRRSGLTDEDVLQRAMAITAGEAEFNMKDRVRRAKALYFIGSCLRKNNDPRAVDYFKQALLAHPLHFRSAIRYLIR